jgi:hypothetical protein
LYCFCTLYQRVSLTKPNISDIERYSRLYPSALGPMSRISWHSFFQRFCRSSLKYHYTFAAAAPLFGSGISWYPLHPLSLLQKCTVSKLFQDGFQWKLMGA